MKNDKLTELTNSLKIIRWCIVIVVSTFILFLLFQSNITTYIISTDIGSKGQFGDYMGGLWGTVISGITLVVVFFTFFNQRTELKLTRKQIEKQQFETVFFNMLEMIHNLGKEFKDIDNNDFFTGFMDRMKLNYESTLSTSQFVGSEHNEIIIELSKKHNIDIFRPKTPKTNINSLKLNGRFLFSEWRKQNIENEQEYVGLLYLKFFRGSNSNLGHFFRYIHNTIKFTIEKREEYGDEEGYINLIQSQLTNHQLLVMFYNCISSISLSRKGEPKIKNWLDKYEVFQNVPVDLLIRPFHQDFYKNTEFKQPHKNYTWSEDDYESRREHLSHLIRTLM
jgi:hypothetical protein